MPPERQHRELAAGKSLTSICAISSAPSYFRRWTSSASTDPSRSGAAAIIPSRKPDSGGGGSEQFARRGIFAKHASQQCDFSLPHPAHAMGKRKSRTAVLKFILGISSERGREFSRRACLSRTTRKGPAPNNDAIFVSHSHYNPLNFL